MVYVLLGEVWTVVQVKCIMEQGLSGLPGSGYWLGMWRL